MHSVVFLILRRMRAPLVVLIVTYAVAVLGFVLIPGVDADGQPWRMSFFHAFYIVSYTATTIGFGEIPYALTDAQRLWMIVSIYLTVVGWFYGLGKILQLMQDTAFQQVVERDTSQRPALLLLADCHLQMGNDARVVELLSPLEAELGDDRLYAYLLGHALLRSQELQPGQAVIDRLFRGGESAEGHLLLGLQYMGRTDTRQIAALGAIIRPQQVAGTIIASKW